MSIEDVVKFLRELAADPIVDTRLNMQQMKALNDAAKLIELVADHTDACNWNAFHALANKTRL